MRRLGEEIGMDRLKDKVALVTDGSSGLGLATAKLFAAEGAFVYITGRRQEALDSAIETIGSNAAGIRGDIAILSDLDRVFEQVGADKRQINILFANAGIGEFVPLGAITEAHFDQTFDVNVKGTLFTVQKLLPLMPKGSSIGS
jgi:NAD(P)-dependent dehydrogenase (short-subunit alcohol dehydrogenase family)